MNSKTMRQIVGIVLVIILMGVMLQPLAVYAEKPTKNVRVGWYESPFNRTDKNGRRSGYAYDYQLKIASYSGWDFTYINGSWSDLLQMLIDGKIDLMSDVSYTEERAENMLFSDIPMGVEEYCIFISPSNKEITAEDYSSLNGKRIGVNKGSVQVDFYNKWAEQHNVSAELVELTSTEVESLKLLASGTLDAYITLNAYGDPDTLVPICKIGSSDFYFVVNKSNPELLDELNVAMNHIQSENPYYNQRMFEKYVQRFGANAFLVPTEKEWLNSHGPIRVGYLENYLAFCATDGKTGELTGALKDYLEYASDCISNAHIDFETKGYSTVETALEAMKNGEVDCVFPTNLSTYDGEKDEILMSSAVMNTDVYAVVRQSNNSIFREKSIERVSSPEKLDDYIKVVSPGIWILLAAIIVLLLWCPVRISGFFFLFVSVVETEVFRDGDMHRTSVSTVATSGTRDGDTAVDDGYGFAHALLLFFI